MLIAIAGATGFIGGHIAQHLLQSGHGVRALVRSGSKATWLQAIGADVRVGDLNDQSFLARNVEGCHIAVNAAGRLGQWGVSEEDLRAVNVAMVKHLLEAVQGTSVRQFIHFSTPGVVGMVGVAPECMPMRPGGAYERTKCEAEKLVMAYHKHGNVPVTVLRPDLVYGPRDLHKLRMFKAVSEGRFPIIGSGVSLLHPTFVSDVVDGTVLVIDNPDAYGQTFNLAGRTPVTVDDLVTCISSALQVDPKRLPIPPILLKLCAMGVETACRAAGKVPPVTRQQIRFFTRDHASDISKAQSVLGYEPRVELEEGVGRTIAWYKQEGYL